jgi:DNA-binding transcriptional regulator YiaG
LRKSAERGCRLITVEADGRQTRYALLAPLFKALHFRIEFNKLNLDWYAIDVKSIRHKTGMSQQRFCATFGISIGTLRHWEQGLRSPRGAARIFLKVVENNPKAVIKAIEQ